MRFGRERAGFEAFRREFGLKDDIRRQTEEAINEVYWTYDTSIRENRFTVGGVVELIVGASLRACGVPVRHRGAVESDVDLLFDDGTGGYSVKAIFKGSGTRLVNTMGSKASPDRWRTATLFLVSGTGIVYADPDLPWWASNRNRCIRPSADAIVVSKRCVVQFAALHPEWKASCRLPTESGQMARPHPARTHTADIAAQVLMHYPALHAAFAGLRPGEEVSGSRC